MIIRWKNVFVSSFEYYNDKNIWIFIQALNRKYRDIFPHGTIASFKPGKLWFVKKKNDH